MIQTKTQKFIAKGILSMLITSGILTATTLADDYMYVVATHLNVRSANSFQSSIVTTVDTGYKVTVLESFDNGWKKILLANGAEGYVNGRYLTGTEPYFEKALGTTYTVTVPTAFVRGENLQSKVAVLKKGDTLEVMDEKVYLGKWLRVKVSDSATKRYNDRVGYISKMLVQVTEGTKYSVSQEQSDTPVSTADDSWIAETDGQILGSAPADTGSTDLSGLGDILGSTAPADTSKTAPADESTSVAKTADTESTDSAGLEDLLGGLMK